MLLVQFSPKEASDELVAAVRSGKLPESVVDERCRKVLAYKYLLGLRGKQPKLQISGLGYRIRTEEAQDLASRLRKASVTVLDNYFDVLPLAADRSKIAVLSMGEPAEDSAFVAAMRQQGVTDVYRLSWQAGRDERAKVREALSAYSGWLSAWRAFRMWAMIMWRSLPGWTCPGRWSMPASRPTDRWRC